MRKLCVDVEWLGAQCFDGEGAAKQFRSISADVQKQLRAILDVLRELTGERAERPANFRYPPPGEAEAVELLEQLLAADLPASLVSLLPLFEFEARKDAMNVFVALLWPGMPQGMDRQVVVYLRDHARVLDDLLQGYENPDVALHSGVMIRSCARHGELVEAMLHRNAAGALVRQAQHPSIEIASDAFFSLRELLLFHKTVAAAWLRDHFASFFDQYNLVLRVGEYVTRRPALTLLSSMFLDPAFKRIMVLYVASDQNLRLHMNLLLDESRAIRLEAYHIVKIFVANPNKPPRVHRIIFQNKAKLVELVEMLRPTSSTDTKLSEDKLAIIHKIQALEPCKPASSDAVSSPTTCRPKREP